MLKSSKISGTVQEVILPDFPDDDNTVTTVTKSRRVSFGTNFVKEFIVGSAVSGQCMPEYEQAFPSSDSSNADSGADSGLLEHSMFVSHNHEIHKSIPTTSQSSEPDSMETRPKVPKFSSTVCFSADSPTADMEFTEGCITLAKSILDKKNKEMTVIIQAKPKEPKEEERSKEDETKYFDGSQVEMSVTRCLKSKGNKREEKRFDGEKTKIFKKFENEMSITRCNRIFNEDDGDSSWEECKENLMPLDMIMRHLDKDNSDLENDLFNPEKTFDNFLNGGPFDFSNESEKLNLNESMDISTDLPNVLKMTENPVSNNSQITKSVEGKILYESAIESNGAKSTEQISLIQCVTEENIPSPDEQMIIEAPNETKSPEPIPVESPTTEVNPPSPLEQTKSIEPICLQESMDLDDDQISPDQCVIPQSPAQPTEEINFHESAMETEITKPTEQISAEKCTTEEIPSSPVDPTPIQEKSIQDTLTEPDYSKSKDEICLEEPVIEPKSTEQITCNIEEQQSPKQPLLDEEDATIQPSLVDVKVIESLKEQSNESGCVWSLKGIRHPGIKTSGLLSVNCTLLESSTVILFTLKMSNEDNLDSCSLVTGTEINLDEETQLRLPEYRLVVDFGYEEMKKFFDERRIEVETIRHVPYFLDQVNSFVVKINSTLRQIYEILTSYPGSRLDRSQLSFRLYSFPIFFSSVLTIDLSNRFKLTKSSLSFKKDFGNLEENKIREIFEGCLKRENSLCEFVVQSTKYLFELEKASGYVSRRRHIRLLPAEFKV